MLLSFSEILQVKSHMDKNSDELVLNEAFENEKNKLIQEIHELRDLLSKISVRLFKSSF
jgi:hypothetical protein